MLIKEKDCIQQNIEQLNTIKNIPNLSQEKLSKIEKEFKILISGNKGEQDSAYFINFYYKKSLNWAIIHDLRIEYDNNVAQIDHLLINRFLDFYVLETKNYAYGVKVTDEGEFLVWTGKKYIAIESPIEQNKRHINLLKSLIKKEHIFPQRLGFSRQPNFFSYILVSPKSRIVRPNPKKFNTESVIKADEFYKQTQDNVENKSTLSSMVSLTKIVSQASLQDIGKKLIKYHKSATPNYYQRFGFSPLEKSQSLSNSKKIEQNISKYYCYKCKKSISNKVASFCFSNKNLFQGKAYCYDCQR